MSNREPLRLRRDVRIASVGAEHAADMLRWMGDPVVSYNLGLRTEPSMERTLAWIDKARTDPGVAAFAILVEDRHVGNVVFDPIDSYLGNARLSVYIGEPTARGAGIATTGMYLAMAEMFGRLGMHKIWLTVHDRNHAGIAAYVRLGFVVEGVLRDEFKLDGRLANAFYMGLLKREFDEAVLDSAYDIERMDRHKFAGIAQG